MARAPKYKIYSAEKEYVACCKRPDDAGAIVALYGDGATIRLGHNTVLWCEGNESQPAGESYDYVAEICWAREHAVLELS